MSKVKSKNSKVAGFTLIESLVAVSLFVIAVTAVTSLFTIYSKTQRESGLRQNALNQLSVDLERFAQDIRLKKIIFSDTIAYRGSNTALYSSDGDATISGKEIEIGLQDAVNANVKEYYFFANPSGAFACTGYFSQNILYRYSDGICNPLFAIDNVTLVDAGFYISPSYNPYPKKDSDCKKTDPFPLVEYDTFDGYHCKCSISTDCHSGICTEGLCSESQPVVTVSLTVRIGDVNNNLLTVQTTISSRQY